MKKLLFLCFSISFFFFFTGCQNDEESEACAKLPYLSFNEKTDYSNLSQDDLEVINKAFQRIEIKDDHGLLKIKQKSGSEINISEDLFYFFKMSVDKTNDRLKLAKIDLSMARTRSYSESGGYNERNDCVAQSIVAVLKDKGVYRSIDSVSREVDAITGGGGVPMNLMKTVLEKYFHVTQVSTPSSSSTPVSSSIAVIHNGSQAHAVTLIGVNNGYAVCRDDQNNTTILCPLESLGNVYRIDGVR